MAMPKLAYLLSRFETERPIIDRTGLEGMYAVKLTWTPRQLQDSSPDATGISLFTALEEQFGLKLEARKGRLTCWWWTGLKRLRVRIKRGLTGPVPSGACR